jgi:hypothetical protein
MYTQFESRPVDAEFVCLIHDLQSAEINGHKYRGYTLLTQEGRKVRSIKVSVQLSANTNFGIIESKCKRNASSNKLYLQVVFCVPQYFHETQSHK